MTVNRTTDIIITGAWHGCLVGTMAGLLYFLLIVGPPIGFNNNQLLSVFMNIFGIVLMGMFVGSATNMCFSGAGFTTWQDKKGVDE